MNTHYGPQTPPRRAGQRSRLTPSATPLLGTPSKTPAFRTAQRSLRFNASKTPSSRRRVATPHHSAIERKTPYFTAAQSPASVASGGAATVEQDKSTNDRFIPSRRYMNMDLCRRTLSLGGEKRPRCEQPPPQHKDDETPLQKEFKRRMLSTLCNVPLEKLTENSEATGILTFGAATEKKHRDGGSARKPYGAAGNAGAAGPLMPNPYALDMLRTMKVGGSGGVIDEYGSQQASVASKVLRKVPSAPVRILDAPDIVDDYYLNLISWSKDNILAVALAKSVYLWNATTGEIHHLITVSETRGGGIDYITSVSWCQEPGQTKYIAVGTHVNEVHIFDGHALKKIRTLTGATGRIASLSWTSNLLSAGDRDACIINHDTRADQNIVSKYMGHTQEVCGLKWNDDGTTLASGGNENFLCLWDAAMSGRRRRNNPAPTNNLGRPQFQQHTPRLILKQHKAAVKALDWCPFHRGLLASGGGTADRSIKFWNSASGAMLNTVDTGSQVCSLVWNRHQREICSSHGYSENQLILWKYPTMTKIKELTGHTARVLNMDISPDGSSIVSAGADETLRFWNIFDTPLSMSLKRHGGAMGGAMMTGLDSDFLLSAGGSGSGGGVRHNHTIR